MAMEAKRMLQDSMISTVLQWAPSLLAMQHSYKQKKSSLVMEQQMLADGVYRHMPHLKQC
jgi:hypothetical protein